MRVFVAVATALLAVLRVAAATEGDDGSVHSLAVPVPQGQSSGTYLVVPIQSVPLSSSIVSEGTEAPGLAATAKTLATTSGGVMLRQSGDRLLCDCGPGKSNVASKHLP